MTTQTFTLDDATFQWDPETETPSLVSAPGWEKHAIFYVVAQYTYNNHEDKRFDLHVPPKLEKLVRVENEDHFKKMAWEFVDDVKGEEIEGEWHPLFMYYKNAIEFYIEHVNTRYTDKVHWMTLHILRPPHQFFRNKKQKIEN